MKYILKGIFMSLFAAVLSAGFVDKAAAFGAIAASQETEGVHIGLVVNFESSLLAREAALEDCVNGGGKNCEIVENFADVCAAIAVSEDGTDQVYGAYALDYDKESAAKSAIASCESNEGVKCVKHHSACDGKEPVDYAELSLPQICTQLCADFDEVKAQSGELTLAAEAEVHIQQEAGNCLWSCHQDGSFKNYCSVTIYFQGSPVMPTTHSEDFERIFAECSGGSDSFRSPCYRDQDLAEAGFTGENPDPCSEVE